MFKVGRQQAVAAAATGSVDIANLIADGEGCTFWWCARAGDEWRVFDVRKLDQDAERTLLGTHSSQHLGAVCAMVAGKDVMSVSMPMGKV